MNKKQFLLSALALITPTLFAQSLVVRNADRKWDGAFDQLIEGQSVRKSAAQGTIIATPATLNDVIINVTENANAVADYLKTQGYTADVISDQCLVAALPAKFIPTLAQRADVVYVAQSQQYAPLLNSVRELTKVDALHAGTGLDTPFDGTGVVVGVIDQGFQYNHMAFKSGTVEYYTGTRFTNVLPNSGDTYSTSAHGHATHVANIAAGRKVTGDNTAKDLYGIAYNSDLLLCSSNFQTSSVLKQATAIKKYAEAAGKPWVINMSFGGHVGPHDGTSSGDQNMNKLMGEGGIMVAAAGNEGGDKIHVKASFTEDDQVKSMYVMPGSTNTSKMIILDIWSTNADGQKGLTIQPLIKTSTKEYIPTASQLRTAFRVTDEVNALNKKQHMELDGQISTLASILGVPANSAYYFIVKVTGNTGNGYHAWLGATGSYDAKFGSNMASFSQYKVQSPSQDYLVGEGAANIPDAIAVGAYNNRMNFKSLSGASYQVGYGSKGILASFSSPGPSVNPDLVKPAVTAPGAGIYSAFNRYDTNVKATAADVVARVKNTGDQKDDFYGMMSGTSQASPVVTGIVALWLQANPKLTPAQVLQIIKETAERDSNTGTADESGWNAKSGYGKIDAYAGLKRALELANQQGISEALNTEAPVSLQKNADSWKVLFNNDETYADIRIVALNGQVVANQRLNAPRRGEETTISLSNLTPGVYLFHVNTTASKLTRKLIVK